MHLGIPLVRGDAEQRLFQRAVKRDVGAGGIPIFVHDLLPALIELVEDGLLVAEKASHRPTTFTTGVTSCKRDSEIQEDSYPRLTPFSL